MFSKRSMIMTATLRGFVTSTFGSADRPQGESHDIADIADIAKTAMTVRVAGPRQDHDVIEPDVIGAPPTWRRRRGRGIAGVVRPAPRGSVPSSRRPERW
jgi:hypothetical protein